jgi:hypothetical protein
MVYVANTNPREKVWSQNRTHTISCENLYYLAATSKSVPLLCCIVFLSFNMLQAKLYVTLTHNKRSVSHAF